MKSDNTIENSKDSEVNVIVNSSDCLPSQILNTFIDNIASKKNLSLSPKDLKIGQPRKKIFFIIGLKNQSDLLQDIQDAANVNPYKSRLIKYKTVSPGEDLSKEDIEEINRAKPNLIFISPEVCEQPCWIGKNQCRINSKMIPLQNTLISYLFSLKVIEG